MLEGRGRFSKAWLTSQRGDRSPGQEWSPAEAGPLGWLRSRRPWPLGLAAPRRVCGLRVCSGRWGYPGATRGLGLKRLPPGRSHRARHTFWKPEHQKTNVHQQGSMYREKERKKTTIRPPKNERSKGSWETQPRSSWGTVRVPRSPERRGHRRRGPCQGSGSPELLPGP